MDGGDDAALIAHLAARWGGFEARRKIAVDAGLPDAQIAGDAETSWRLLLDEARERGRRDRLLQRIAAEDPAVARYLSIGSAALAVRRGVEPMWIAAGALGVSAVFAVLALGYVALTRTTATETVASRDNSSTVAEPAVPPPPSEGPAAKVVDPPVAAAVPDAAVAEVPVPVAAPAAAVAEKPSIKDDTPASGSVCPAAGADGVIGYAYTGRDRPKVEGGQFVAEGWMNVRADYPRKENHYSSRAKSRCAVSKGMVVSVRDPEVVDGWALWWPVTAVHR